jgi:hypothetical protein
LELQVSGGPSLGPEPDRQATCERSSTPSGHSVGSTHDVRGRAQTRSNSHRQRDPSLHIDFLDLPCPASVAVLGCDRRLKVLSPQTLSATRIRRETARGAP